MEITFPVGTDTELNLVLYVMPVADNVIFCDAQTLQKHISMMYKTCTFRYQIINIYVNVQKLCLQAS